MKITSRADAGVPKTVHEAVDHLANTRFNRFASAIREVRATVTDLNGPKGGVDIRCQLYVTLGKGQKVVIQETAATVREAISIAFDRATRTIARRMDRMRPGRPTGDPRPLSQLAMIGDS